MKSNILKLLKHLAKHYHNWNKIFPLHANFHYFHIKYIIYVFFNSMNVKIVYIIKLNSLNEPQLDKIVNSKI